MAANSWGMKYEDWERHAVPATDERVREAVAYERMGWPMPISGDLTRQGITAATHCSCQDPITQIDGNCALCGLVSTEAARLL